MLASSYYKTVRYKRLALQVRNTNSSAAEGNFEVTSDIFNYTRVLFLIHVVLGKIIRIKMNDFLI